MKIIRIRIASGVIHGLAVAIGIIYQTMGNINTWKLKIMKIYIMIAAMKKNGSFQNRKKWLLSFEIETLTAKLATFP